MGRELRRVPLDFDWPLVQVWAGFILPGYLREQECPRCKGDGYSDYARYYHNQWYGKDPLFHPSSKGSEPYTPDTPEVRAFAERNVASAPEFYGTSEADIVREATRLAELFNQRWMHHIDQDDVDALIKANRLRDFTHTWSKEDGWQPKENPVITPNMVNRWSITGFGHDSINAWAVVAARCEREGFPVMCEKCEGHGSLEKYPGQRAEADAWEPTQPPTGEGWQVWETVSEGSPVTPVFATPEELINHLTTVGTTGGKIWDWATAVKFVKDTGWAPTLMTIGADVYTPENIPNDLPEE